MRDRHLDLHQAGAQDDSPNKTLLPDPESDDFLPLLFDLIAIDDVKAVEKLPRFADRSGHNAFELLKFVAHSGSAAMTKLICETGYWESAYFQKWDAIILAAVNSQNIESLSVLLSDPYDAKASISLTVKNIQRCCKLLEHSFMTGSMEVVQAIGTFFRRIYNKRKRNLFWYITQRTVIRATARCPEREEFLINEWSNHSATKPSSVDIVRILRNIARTTYSIPLAQALLQYNINIDQRQHEGLSTALHWAARGDCAEAAEFMKFLLYQGANPKICAGIRDETCVKNISKWLGISWDELLQKVKEDRKRGVQWP